MIRRLAAASGAVRRNASQSDQTARSFLLTVRDGACRGTRIGMSGVSLRRATGRFQILHLLRTAAAPARL